MVFEVEKIFIIVEIEEIFQIIFGIEKFLQSDNKDNLG